jgi:hypothetical protein
VTTSRRLLTGVAAAALGLGLIPLGSASPAGAATEQSTRYVARTLRVLEGEAPSELVDPLAERLDGGTSRRTIVAERVNGDAHREATVVELYADILGRAPSVADVDYWSDRIGTVGEYRVRAELLSAGELIASVMGDKGAFVEMVYAYGLDRGASEADVEYWSARTGDTASSRSQLAWWVLRSAEGRTIVARDLFEEILARTPDAGSRDFYAGRLTVAKGIENVTITLASSGEAFTEAQERDTLLVLLEGNTVATVDAETFDPVVAPVAFTDSVAPNLQLGITPGTSLVAIDVRPHTQVLYGLGSDGQLYSLNTTTVTAAKIGVPIVPLAGDVVGFDFNPTVDRIRISTTGGENYRINPDTGGVASTDAPLAYAAGDRNEGDVPGVTGAAYTNSARGELGTALPASTVLYDVDAANDALVRQDPPNDGTLNTVGRGLGTDVEGTAGFDISPDTGRAWAVMSDDLGYASFRIDLTSGRAIRQTSLPDEGDVLGIAVAPSAPAASGQGWVLSSDGVLGTHSVTAVDLAAPDSALATLTITGVNTLTSLGGLDVRSATGMPYVLGSDGQLYVLGAPKAATPTTVPAEKVGMPISNAVTWMGDAGFDFNPAVDRLRILIGTTNLRVNPNTGTLVDGDPVAEGVQEDSALAYAVGDVGEGDPVTVLGGAYTNAPRGGVAATTQLFDIESDADALVLQDPPNAGTLVTRGQLGVDVGTDGGFDVQTGTGTAFLLGSIGGVLQLRTVDLATGATTLVGSVPVLPDSVGFTTT